MRIEIPLFDGFDELDVFGPFEVLAGAGFDVELVNIERPGQIVSQSGVKIDATATLYRPDAVIVPGGGWLNRAPEGAWAQAQRGTLAHALVALMPTLTFAAAVCTGSMLLANAGLLRGRYATTNRNAWDELAEHDDVHVVRERVVDDGTIITAGGLTAGIDLALWVVEHEHGSSAADQRALDIEYERQGRVWHAPMRRSS